LWRLSLFFAGEFRLTTSMPVSKLLSATRSDLAAAGALDRRHVAALLLFAWLLTLGGAAPSADASGEPFNERSKPMAAKSKPVARKFSFDDAELIALLPASLGGWTLSTMERPEPSPALEPVPALRAEYALGKQTVKVTLSTVFPASASDNTQTIYHDRDEARQHNTAVLKLQNGLTIIASSHLADAQALAQLINSIDLPRAQKLKAQRK
jgi:hypothetical protein